MTLTNEAHLRHCLAEICQADTSTGPTKGLTVLMNTSRPIVRWGDKGMNSRPIIAYHVPAERIRRGTKDALVLTGIFDIFVEESSTGTEEAIADRLEAIVTHTNLNSTARTNPVDVAPFFRSRRELPDLDEGRRRLQVEFEMWFNRIGA